MANRFNTIVTKINAAPTFLRSFLLTKLFSTTVKYAGTSCIKINEVSKDKVLLSLKNHKSVQNHIGGIHVPDSKFPLLKSMTINYQRRMQGNLSAEATLTSEQAEQIEQDVKGAIEIAVVINDESGLEPIVRCMDWAWVTKRAH